MTPIVNGLTAEFANEINVYQLDAAQPAVLHLQQRYGLRGHPSFALLTAEGELADTFFGPQEGRVLRSALEAMLTE